MEAFMRLYKERCRFRSLLLIELWFRALRLRILGRTPGLLGVSGFRGSRRLIHALLPMCIRKTFSRKPCIFACMALARRWRVVVLFALVVAAGLISMPPDEVELAKPSRIFQQVRAEVASKRESSDRVTTDRPSPNLILRVTNSVPTALFANAPVLSLTCVLLC